MPNRGEARIIFQGSSVEVFVTDSEVREWLDLGHQGENEADILMSIAREKVSSLNETEGVRVVTEAPKVVSDAIDWDAVRGGEESGKLRRAFCKGSGAVPNDGPGDLVTTCPDCKGTGVNKAASVRRASNPSQQAANEALKIAKELQNLLNTLAGLQSREEIATAAGLTDLQTMIERVYELADRYRQGGITELRPAYAEYQGWDPDKLRQK